MKWQIWCCVAALLPCYSTTYIDDKGYDYKDTKIKVEEIALTEITTNDVDGDAKWKESTTLQPSVGRRLLSIPYYHSPHHIHSSRQVMPHTTWFHPVDTLQRPYAMSSPFYQPSPMFYGTWPITTPPTQLNTVLRNMMPNGYYLPYPVMNAYQIPIGFDYYYNVPQFYTCVQPTAGTPQVPVVTPPPVPNGNSLTPDLLTGNQYPQNLPQPIFPPQTQAPVPTASSSPSESSEMPVPADTPAEFPPPAPQETELPGDIESGIQPRSPEEQTPAEGEVSPDDSGVSLDPSDGQAANEDDVVPQVEAVTSGETLELEVVADEGGALLRGEQREISIPPAEESNGEYVVQETENPTYTATSLIVSDNEIDASKQREVFVVDYAESTTENNPRSDISIPSGNN